MAATWPVYNVHTKHEMRTRLDISSSKCTAKIKTLLDL